MTQVGIGQLKHANRPEQRGGQKAQQSGAFKAAQSAATQKKPLSSVRHPHPSPKTDEQIRKTAENPAEREGQLSVDIIQREDQMIVVCPIAGVDKGDIKVAIQDDVLTIRGERKKLEGIEPSEALVRELFWGTFSRSIVLPDHIDRKHIQARAHEHLLIITIPKTEDFKTRIIHIKDEA